MASSDAFKAQQQKGTVMRTPLILAGATLLLSSCGDKNEAAEEKLERAAETRSEEHTSELQSLMRISYAVFCLKKKIQQYIIQSIKLSYHCIIHYSSLITHNTHYIYELTR